MGEEGEKEEEVCRGERRERGIFPSLKMLIA